MPRDFRWVPLRERIDLDAQAEQAKLERARQPWQPMAFEPMGLEQPEYIPLSPFEQPQEPMRGMEAPEPIPTWRVKSQQAPMPQWEMPTGRMTSPQPELDMATAQLPESPTPEWYEMPREWAETGMEKMGEFMSKAPVLPEALKFVAPAFEFIHEKLEKPFAALITSPWSPSLSWNRGESWIDHEKREYEAWKAPTYVKGVAEFAMPLWWMPWLGWAAKGARALGAGNKMARALSTLPKAGKVRLPTKEILSESLYKLDFFKTVALWAENKPFISGVVRAIGGPSAFVKGTGTTPLEIVNRELVNRAVLMDMRHGVRGLLVPKLQKYGNAQKLLQIDDAGRMMSATPKAGSEHLGRGLSEVFEHPSAYEFATTEARDFVMDFGKITKEIYELAAKEGVKVPKEVMYHRIVKGIETMKGYEASEYGSLFELSRTIGTMEQGIKGVRGKIIHYGNDPIESINSTINHFMKKIANKRFDDAVKPLGKTPMEKFATQFPDEALRISELTAKKTAADYAMRTVASLLSHKGTSIPPAQMTKIRNAFPELATRIEEAFVFRPQEMDKVIGAMGREIWRVTKMKPEEFKIALAQYLKTPSKILVRDIEDAVRSLNAPKRVTDKAIENTYKEAYRTRKDIMKGILTDVKNDATKLLDDAKAGLKIPLSQRSDFLKVYRTKAALGEFEAQFTKHPAFRGKFFDRQVVDAMDRVIGDKGVDWIRRMGAVSGTSRMLVAAMDFSAPFIQGLAPLGRNPVAWLKAVKKQFEFFAKPENMYKYMDDPVNMAIRAERIAYGGSSSTFEFFEAMAPLQRVIGRVPVAGRVGRRVIGETYGRAEAAFTGFGEVARNEMWKALKKPNMTEVQLRELARTTDRMTGVMSMEALAIGRIQRDFENAFVFFAPRYTRASLSFVADVFKGGMSGANARISLGALMASGFTMYYGACKALGQTPELDPKSARFMTVKIGDDHVGIGGILYGLMRFATAVGATAIGDEPLDLVRLSRFDNPFIKFMFNRTAPLTGALVNIIEQKNYFGEPFETPADWARFMAEKVTPIAMQRALLEEGVEMPVPVFTSEMMGMRTFPKSAWEMREESREKYAQERYQKPYATLPKLYQRMIDEEPDIQMLQEEADVRTAQRGGLSAEFLSRQRERDDARFMYVSRLNELQVAYDAEMINGYEFKEELQTAGYGLGMTYKHIDTREQYKEVMEKLEEPRDVSDEFIGDLAYDELTEASFSDKFIDSYGLFQYDAYNEFRESLRRKYGDSIWQYVLQREGERHKELPPLAQEYYKAREVLRPYWQVQEDIERQRGKPKNEWQAKAIDRIVSKIRKYMRLSNPEMAKYYELFYTRPPF